MRLFDKCKLLLAGMALPAVIGAADFPAFLYVKDRGSLMIDTRYEFTVSRFAPPDWKPSDQRKVRIAPGFPHRQAGIFELEGKFDGFRLRETVTGTGRNSFSWSMQLQAGEKPVPCQLLFGALNLPYESGVTVAVDGKTVAMSDQVRKKNVFDAPAEQVAVTDRFGTLTIRGKFRAVVAGNFVNANGNYYQLRLMPVKKMPDSIRDWKLELEFEGDFSRFDVKSETVDLSGVFNRAFHDEVAGDGKGGWTDQGPEMDLRSLRNGMHDFNNIRIKVEAGDKACLVLREGETAQLPVAPKTVENSHLYLLHASAWTPMFPQPVGTLEIGYADGSREKLPVVAGRDCGNWYQPVNFSNAFVAWQGKVPSAAVGLYLSGFPLKGTPRMLKFTGAKGVWMIAGAALADGRARFPVKGQAFVVEAGPRWLPIRFDGKTAANSPLDFSGFRDMPAGKYGRIVANREGHLVFENAPEKRIRLFGPNLVGTANYLDRKTAEDFIEKAERLGYNTIRFHHFENDLLDRKAQDSLTIDPVKLDQLHYLFARLKERGFYLCIDLYASRRLKAGDNIPEFDNTGEFSMKNLVCISPAALENWKEFARRVLTAKNPYTGMTMAEDPALYALNLVNENTLITEWDCVRTSRAAAEIIRKRFREYLKRPGTPQPDDNVRENGLFIEFLQQLQADCIAEQMRFLRNELKLKALITDLNHQHQFTLAGLRSKLDLVDNHQYWDHPSFPMKRWNYPFCFRNQSAISLEAASPRLLMPTRIFGKPFTVTEFNFCVPNTYRVECPTVFGGYAALQDWDGLYRFAWSHGKPGMRNVNRVLSQFDIVNNIQAQMAERIMYLLFVRGDVRPAESAVAFSFKPEQIRRVGGNSRAGAYPDAFSRLGLWGRIGTLPEKTDRAGVLKVDPLENGWERSLPQPARDALETLGKTGIVSSSTGELTLDKKRNQLRIVTPRSEVVTGTGDAACKVMRVSKMNCYQTVALQSLDERPLTESGKLLLSHLTDLSNDQLQFDDDSRRVLRSWGKLPQMLEKGSAEVQLSLPREMRVTPLQLNGTPADRPLETSYRDGVLSFRIATDLLPGGNLGYVLTPVNQ